MIVIDTIERTLADQGVTLFAMVDALINGRTDPDGSWGTATN